MRRITYVDMCPPLREQEVFHDFDNHVVGILWLDDIDVTAAQNRLYIWVSPIFFSAKPIDHPILASDDIFQTDFIARIEPPPRFIGKLDNISVLLKLTKLVLAPGQERSGGG